MLPLHGAELRVWAYTCVSSGDLLLLALALVWEMGAETRGGNTWHLQPGWLGSLVCFALHVGIHCLRSHCAVWNLSPCLSYTQPPGFAFQPRNETSAEWPTFTECALVHAELPTPQSSHCCPPAFKTACSNCRFKNKWNYMNGMRFTLSTTTQWFLWKTEVKMNSNIMCWTYTQSTK